MKKLTRIIAVMIAICMAAGTGSARIPHTGNIDAAVAGIRADENYQRTKITGSLQITRICDDGICGVTSWKGDYIEYEGFAGIRTHCDGTRVTYTMYSHNYDLDNGTVSFVSDDDMKTAVKLSDMTEGMSKTFDITDYAAKPGLYVLHIDIPYKNRTYYANTNLYYDGKVVKACRRLCVENIDSWRKLVGNLDPDKCLGMYVVDKNVPITYPTSGMDGNCNHVEEWRSLAHEIVKFDYWDNEMKVFALVNYLSRNYAYDYYRVRTLDNVSRATTAKCWTDDSLWMYYNKVGQCWDFANAMTVMCRELGIPCTTVENDYHTVNAVWMYGEWVSIDVSQLVGYGCFEKDTDPDKWVADRQGSFSGCYGRYCGDMNNYNQCIATPETTLSNRSGRNPI
ncbi:MAG: transglutaminase-like domain-containing protein [Lachnospiraceae bacterium]|nr:transglutaminase-like domain-containing protein [Lachnospiraceae bacterium]